MGKPFLLSRIHWSQMFSSDFNLAGMINFILSLLSKACKKLFWKNLKPLRKIPIWAKSLIFACSFWNSRKLEEFLSKKFVRSQMVSDHLSSGNFQDISEESKRIPKTVPKVEDSKALSWDGQGGANSTFNFLHTLLYVDENDSTKFVDSGATVGTLSSCRWMRFLGVSAMVAAMFVTVSPKSSNFAGAAVDPKAMVVSAKEFPNHFEKFSKFFERFPKRIQRFPKPF